MKKLVLLSFLASATWIFSTARLLSVDKKFVEKVTIVCVIAGITVLVTSILLRQYVLDPFVKESLITPAKKLLENAEAKAKKIIEQIPKEIILLIPESKIRLNLDSINKFSAASA
jgi:hypothetical protein